MFTTILEILSNSFFLVKLISSYFLISNHQLFSLHYPWDTNEYKPEVHFTLNVFEDAFLLHIETLEQNPRREEHQHLNFVHFDSCVEWFVNFAPKTCDHYFSFEIYPGISNPIDLPRPDFHRPEFFGEIVLK